MSTVGHSDRTPCKHQLMSRIFGREIGALSTPRFDGVPGAYWVDLTAGDGVAANGGEWVKNCSPGILAHHGRFAGNRKPVQIVLFERAPRTYATLIDNLASQLPGLGYSRDVDHEASWTCRQTRLTAANADSATFDPSMIPMDWAVQIVNDPNTVNTWAMDPGLMAAVKDRSWACLGMSTMGCNAAGLLRLDREERDVWYGHVEAQVRGLHRYHDLMLAAIKRDASKWAYLVTAPIKWQIETTFNARGAFAKGGYELECVWLRNDATGFHDLLDRLFLTRDERGVA